MTSQFAVSWMEIYITHRELVDKRACFFPSTLYLNAVPTSYL